MLAISVLAISVDESLGRVRSLAFSAAAALLVGTASCATARADEPLELLTMTDASVETTDGVYDGMPTLGVPL